MLYGPDASGQYTEYGVLNMMSVFYVCPRPRPPYGLLFKHLIQCMLIFRIQQMKNPDRVFSNCGHGI
jgi:hypothetical protein